MFCILLLFILVVLMALAALKYACSTSALLDTKKKKRGRKTPKRGEKDGTNNNSDVETWWLWGWCWGGDIWGVACVHREDHALLFSPPPHPLFFFCPWSACFSLTWIQSPAPLLRLSLRGGKAVASCRLHWSPARRGGGGWVGRGRRVGRDEGGECVPLEAETRRAKEVVERGGRWQRERSRGCCRQRHNMGNPERSSFKVAVNIRISQLARFCGHDEK